MSKELRWEISSSEQKRRNLTAVLILTPIIIGYYFITYWTGRTYSFKEFLYTLLFIILIIAVLYFFLSRKTYKKRTYLLTDNKISVSKGNESKEYSWTEFEYFYSSRKWTKSKFYPQKREVMGDTYYLRKKPKNFIAKLYKNFLVIYSEPENDKDVHDFLSNHLPARASIKDELGLIFYEFK